MMEFLIKKGSQIDALNKYGMSVFHIGAQGD
jgi:hypothetical protein